MIQKKNPVGDFFFSKGGHLSGKKAWSKSFAGKLKA